MLKAIYKLQKNPLTSVCSTRSTRDTFYSNPGDNSVPKLFPSVR